MKKFILFSLASIGLILFSCKKEEEPEPNTAPTVEITAPYDGDVYGGGSSGTNVNITISSADSDGSVSKLEVYDGTTLLTTIHNPTSPYSYTQAFSLGDHSLTVKATDNDGASTTSTAVDLSVINTVVVVAVH